MGAPLVQINQKNEAVPHVAESFEPADGAKKWVFKIRKGITFHDGKTLTADDVVATINYHIGPDSKSPAKGVLSNLVSRQGRWPRHGDLRTERRQCRLPLPAVRLPPRRCTRPKAARSSGKRASAPVPTCSSPSSRACKLAAERNPNYFGTTWFDGVEVLSIIDVAARTNAYLSGEVHFIDRADLKTIDMLKNAPETELYNVSGFAHYTAPMHCDAAPFNDVEVRQAIKWAINRQELVDKILYGYGSPGNDNPLSPVDEVRDQPEPVYTYDPEKAKSLLKKAGMENLKVDLSASDAAFPGGVDAGLLMAEQRQGRRHRDQRDPRAERQLLGQRLAQEALEPVLLGRPSDGGLPSCRSRWRPMRPGTTRAGRTRASTSCSSRPVPRRTKPSARPCMPSASSSSTTTAARSC